MSMCRGRSIAGAVAMLAAALCLSGASAIAATGATKDEAVTMVKKAVGAIKSDGTRKAYAEISDHGGPFVDRDLYIVVYNLDGLVLAHGADEKRIGTN